MPSKNNRAVSQLGLRSFYFPVVPVPHQTYPQRRELLPVEIRSNDVPTETERLKQLGLNFNPFEVTEAGRDSNIPFYLVGNEAFEKISQQAWSFVFAPRGGGKTAFRIRLSLECRSGALSPNTFALNYSLPAYYNYINVSKYEDIHYDYLTQAAAEQLLLVLAYSPGRFNRLGGKIKARIKRFLIEKLVSLKAELHFLSENGIDYLINTVDPTMLSIVNSPSVEEVHDFCRELLDTTAANPEKLTNEQWFEEFVDLIFSGLAYEGLFILIDGIDAYPETEFDAEKGTEMVEHLLKITPELEKQKIYLKFFLPAEYYGYLSVRFDSLLTQDTKVAKINWDVESLEEVVYRRLWEASDRSFGSLRAISEKTLRGMEKSPEQMIIEQLSLQGKNIPREVIIRIRQLIQNRLNMPQEEGIKLTKEDLQQVLAR